MRAVVCVVCMVAGIAVTSTGVARAAAPPAYKIGLFAGQEVAANGDIGVSCASPPFCGDGLPATSAELTAPVGVAVDRSNDVFISDSGADEVREVVRGIITLDAGDGAPCFTTTPAPSCGDGGKATVAELSEPQSVAVDAAGDVFIADYAASEIREVLPSGTIRTVVGTGLACTEDLDFRVPNSHCGDGGPATQAELTDPTGIAVDAAGDLFIADQGDDEVREVSGGTIRTIAGNGVTCQVVSGCGIGGPATSAELDSPAAVAVDARGDVYIADSGDVDSGESTVLMISGGILTRFAGSGAACASPPDCGDGGPATNATLSHPSGIAVDANGNVYIADGGDVEVREVVDGTIYRIAGSGVPCTYDYSYAPHCFYDGGPATAARLNNPAGVAVGPDGTVYVADEGDTAVRELIPPTPSKPLFAAPLPGAAPVSYFGRASIRVLCSGGAAGALCTGTIVLADGPTVLASGGFAVPSGATDPVTVQLPPGVLARLAAAPQSSLAVRATVTLAGSKSNTVADITLTLAPPPADVPEGAECSELGSVAPSFASKEKEIAELPSIASDALPIAVTAGVSLGSVGICRQAVSDLLPQLDTTGPSATKPQFSLDFQFKSGPRAVERSATFSFVPPAWHVPSDTGAPSPPAPKLDWGSAIEFNPSLSLSLAGEGPELSLELLTVPIATTSATLLREGEPFLEATLGPELDVGLKLNRRLVESLVAAGITEGLGSLAAAEMLSDELGGELDSELTAAAFEADPVGTLGYEPWLNSIQATAEQSQVDLDAALQATSVEAEADASAAAADAVSTAPAWLDGLGAIADGVGDEFELVGAVALLADRDLPTADVARRHHRHFRPPQNPRLVKTQGRVLGAGRLNASALTVFHLADFHRGPLPRREIVAAVHGVLALPVTSRVGALAVDARKLKPGGRIGIIAVGLGREDSHTALLVLDGPGYHAVRLLHVAEGGAGALIRLPRHLSHGHWTIAVEDLSGITLSGTRLVGDALVRMAIFDR